ncbi:hypothetical protein SAMN05216198_1530 [Halopseudomonas litoralis]|uniref:Uncharacterized protein n=1 Tax=Halopseudomonas litoralis TaxID=797277 RepID=A0A1H1QMN1_9GAMM|nr:hypothetical protein [Halopseudomonas litoralis]SDS24741.1 hypothetical protein SAMN05216198_1530 [Halopseudomonas litoralis]
MKAMTPAERQREKRARDKLKEEERQARLLAYRLQVDIYHATAELLSEIMATCELEERQDAITRLIHNASRLPGDQLRDFMRQP